MRLYIECGKIGCERAAQVVERPAGDTTFFVERLLVLRPTCIGCGGDIPDVIATCWKKQIAVIGNPSQELRKHVPIGKRVRLTIFCYRIGKRDGAARRIEPTAAQITNFSAALAG